MEPLLKPWEQAAGETPKAYDAFCAYRDLGPGRSLAKTAQKLGRPSGYTRQLETWCSANRWVSRSADYDRYLEGQKRTRAEAMWLERAEALREDEWSAREGLLEKARQMAKLPITNQTLKRDVSVKDPESGEFVTANVVIYKPANWSAGDVPRYLEAASKLGRLATGLGTERTEHTGKGGAPLDIPTLPDVSGLNDEELEQFRGLLARALATSGGGGEPS